MREADRPFRPKQNPTVQVNLTETLTHRSGYINQPDSPCESRKNMATQASNHTVILIAVLAEGNVILQGDFR